MNHKNANLDELYSVRKHVIHRTIVSGVLLLVFLIGYELALLHAPHINDLYWHGQEILFVAALLWVPRLKSLRWLSRYKRLAWVIQETEPLEVAVSREDWLFLSRLKFRVNETTSLRSVEGHDPDLGRLYCLPPIYPIDFSRAQRKLFDNGPVLAEVYVDPESYSVSAIRTPKGLIFPDLIKRLWFQPQ